MSDERASEQRGWCMVCKFVAPTLKTSLWLSRLDTAHSTTDSLCSHHQTRLSHLTSHFAISYTTAIFLSLQREAACSLIIRPNASLTNLATSSVDRPLTCANGSPKTLVSGTGRGPINGVNGSRVHL